jgi:class 3 adenylate cyclase
MTGGPAGMMHTRLNSEPVHFTPAPLTSVMKMVDVDPVVEARVAINICDMARRDPVLPDARGSVGYGLVTARDGDYFGPLVNIVARSSKVAPAGGVFVTAEVARFLDPTSWSTESMGPQDLRGVRERVHLSHAIPVGPGSS